MTPFGCPGGRVDGEVHERLVSGQCRRRRRILTGTCRQFGDLTAEFDGGPRHFGGEPGQVEAEFHHGVLAVVRGALSEGSEASLERRDPFVELP